MITIKKGLKLPISGEPRQVISSSIPVTQVAILGGDYKGMKPTMKVKVGDRVKLGQPLFEDKKNPGVLYTAPGAGRVIEINRGERRVLLSVVIELEGDDAVSYPTLSAEEIEVLSREDVQSQLLSSGGWASFKTRPFGKTPTPYSTPNSIFITCMDTSPLAADVATVLKGKEARFQTGMKILEKLTDGKLYVCKSPDLKISLTEIEKVQVHSFRGHHPAGLAGTHIHFLDPVHAQKTVWSINYQDVIAIGSFFETGKIDVERVVSLAGPSVKNPRLIKTRLGASISQLVHQELKEGDHRVISGSVLAGVKAHDVLGYLGRYHFQISALEEGKKREFLGWMRPGANQFSIKNIFLSKFLPKRLFDFNTSENGSPRTMVPIGMYEKVMPLDIQPTFLLRSLIVKDTTQAQALGCLELDEEDLALCTYVCPGKYNYGSILRENLIKIEKEG